MAKKIYIRILIMENYASFKGKHEFDFRDEEGYLNQWTVILGNNNAGKTNFLRALAGLELKQLPVNESGKNDKIGSSPVGLSEYMELEEHFDVGCSLSYSVKKSTDYNVFNEKLELYKPIEADMINYRYSGQGGLVLSIGRNGEDYKDFKLFGYGVSRRSSQESSLSSKKEDSNSETLFDANATLVNLEEWLLQLDYAAKSGNETAKKQLSKLRELIESDVFPEIKGIHFNFESTKPHVEFETTEGKRRLNGLGYGYQTTLSWIFDLSKKMFERYPDSEHPLREAAVVLIDELDLHLHPQWQREIIKYLSDIFVQTQFIVTTHSPFIIQSIDKLNLFVLNKTEEGTTVEKSPFSTFKGWTVEEILDEVLGLGDKTRTEEYRRLINAFDEGLDTDDYEKSHAAYEELSKILHPYSAKRRLLEIQLSQLIPND